MKPRPEFIIENAAQVLTLNGEKGSQTAEEKVAVLPRGAVAMAKGQILWVGPQSQLAENMDLSAPSRRIDASGKVVLPGFIDAHTHLIFAGSREEEFELRLQGATYQEIAAKGGGIKSTVQKTRKASKEELVLLGQKNLNTMLSLGTTTVEAKSGYGLSTRDEMKMLEALRDLGRNHPVEIVPTFMGAHEIPQEYAGKKDEYVRLILEEMLPAVGEKKLAAFCDVFCETGVFSIDDSRRILEAARKWGMIPKIHADELTHLGGAELAAEIGAASADHLLFASEKGMDALAAKGVVATLLPGTAFFLFLGQYAPARKMIARGVTVALASDFNPGSCMTQNLPLIGTLACTQMRMTPAEAILGITLHAARALRRENEIGSVEPGKQADLLILDIPDYRRLLYHFGVNHVWKVIKKGRVVFEKSEGYATG